MSSPTQRTLKLLRDEGYLAQVVEKWIPQTKRRLDLFGFIDIMAIKGTETLAVQATSSSNISSRVKKIADSDTVGAVRDAGWRIEVIGWRKNSKNRWVSRRVDVS